MLTPAQDWPRVEDPSIIAPFYSRCKIGELNGNEGDDGLDEHANKKPGVYFRSVSFYSAQHEFHVTNQSVFRNTQKKRKYLRQAKYIYVENSLNQPPRCSDTRYVRLERDLYSRTDKLGVQIRERTKWDIRESMVGTETFEPKHVIVATWKNVSFAGGIPIARRTVKSY